MFLLAFEDGTVIGPFATEAGATFYAESRKLVGYTVERL